MTAQAAFQVVEAKELFRYPIPVGVRLESHGWFQFHHAWWRTSEFRRDADREVRAVFLDLLCAAQDEDPVGTLPMADRELAWVARMSLDDWLRLTSRDVTPLHGWKPCTVSDGRMRFYHPKLLQVTEGAARMKVEAETRRADDRERKRLKELPDRILRAGGSQRLAQDLAYICRLDQFLLDTLEPGKSRTAARVREAMEKMELADTRFAK
ncbi:hypothetical protein JI664_03600 [Rhodobacter sp. NTK016B]|uniref:hypothetical protein n=1 Tax=Rhodobacter sp. NTK016B TaxID=2759676 RepID=UPI001A8C7446|nr:hypothetical protein [Rhodobacter sp. NTK016B]MBN8291042.1 hypothetical protein [Rhodobacter sp. NTK016B]